MLFDYLVAASGGEFRSGTALWRFCLLMFPSSGLFAVIDCPFAKNGLCDRPHCLYKHVTQPRNVHGASPNSSVLDLAGKSLLLCHISVAC